MPKSDPTQFQDGFCQSAGGKRWDFLSEEITLTTVYKRIKQHIHRIIERRYKARYMRIGNRLWLTLIDPAA